MLRQSSKVTLGLLMLACFAYTFLIFCPIKSGLNFLLRVNSELLVNINTVSGFITALIFLQSL